MSIDALKKTIEECLCDITFSFEDKLCGVSSEVHAYKPTYTVWYGNDYFDFQGKRMLLFNEKMVADSIAREGGLSTFSNSFLVEACRNDCLDERKVIFAKINSDRRKAYRIKTVIQKDLHNCEVIKTALCEEAIDHIDRIERNSKIVINKKIRYLSAGKSKDTVKYKYIPVLEQLPYTETVLP